MNNPQETPDGSKDAKPSYAGKVNAPLSPEMIKALRKALESGERAKFRRPRKDAGKR